MGRTFLLAAALTITLSAALLTVPASAQTAFRCDSNGQTVYSDKPCPPGNTAKAVVSTKETPEQKAASEAANAQMRKDNADLNKRLSEREKLEAKERADARRAAAKARADALKDKASKSGSKAKGAKLKAPRAAAKKKMKSTRNAIPSTS